MEEEVPIINCQVAILPAIEIFATAPLIALPVTVEVEVELMFDEEVAVAVGIAVDVEMDNSFEFGLDDITHLDDKDGKNGKVCVDDCTAVAVVLIMVVEVLAVELLEGAVGGDSSSLSIIGPLGVELTPVALEVVIATEEEEEKEEEEEEEKE